ncbi:hypothetical protein ACDH53_27220, partial [Pseudomonas tremae]
MEVLVNGLTPILASIIMGQPKNAACRETGWQLDRHDYWLQPRSNHNFFGTARAGTSVLLDRYATVHKHPLQPQPIKGSQQALSCSTPPLLDQSDHWPTRA